MFNKNTEAAAAPVFRLTLAGGKRVTSLPACHYYPRLVFSYVRTYQTTVTFVLFVYRVGTWRELPLLLALSTDTTMLVIVRMITARRDFGWG